MTTRGRRGPRRREEAGYVAILVSILFPLVFLGCAAVAVDTSRWYLEGERVQRAADAAALAGVTYLPQDLDGAKARAQTVVGLNGYDVTSSKVSLTIARGSKPSQLSVTLCSTIGNTFGATIGVSTAQICRSATADYTGPAPMGSPCNVFGNEPPAGGGSSSPQPRYTGTYGVGTALGTSPYSNCSSAPQFWGEVEGPETDKAEGDRYQTLDCASSATDGCTSGDNTEYNDDGYFFLVRITASMVGKPVSLQLYDPAFVNTGQACDNLPSSGFTDSMNPYVGAEANYRYSSASGTVLTGSTTKKYFPTGASYCTGDSYVSSDTNTDPLTTSYVLRAPASDGVPVDGTPLTGCVKQYGSITTTPTVASLTATSSSYNPNLAEVYHNWDALCTFTPTTDGSYFLQVRTDVSLGGTTVKSAGTSTTNNGKSFLIYSGNAAAYADSPNTTSGSGGNSFAVRAVPVDGSGTYQPSLSSYLSVSGYDRMPIYANSDAANTTFNLIRVVSGAAGQYISFTVFDLGDATSNGTVKIVVPSDATGSVTSTPFPNGCRAVGGYAGTAGSTSSTCTFTVTKSANGGKAETFSVPVPADYSCNESAYGGCWYQAKVTFPSGSVTDVTTWDAQIVGDPVRLIK